MNLAHVISVHNVAFSAMVICLERGADLHMAQQMPLPLNVSCFSKIHICFPFGSMCD